MKGIEVVRCREQGALVGAVVVVVVPVREEERGNRRGRRGGYHTPSDGVIISLRRPSCNRRRQ